MTDKAPRRRENPKQKGGKCGASGKPTPDRPAKSPHHTDTPSRSGKLSRSEAPSRSGKPSCFAALDSNPAHNKPTNARQLCELDALDYDAEKARTNPLPELLLPAGSPAALDAAIEAGADAVYFGASAFSARARAVNFSDGEIERAVSLCRAYGVKAYAAVNTRIRDTEIERALALVEQLYLSGVDAVIAADLGLCSVIRERFPDLELHASTQLTPVFKSDADALADLGFSRMVSPRELSYGELCELCRESPIEIEAFIHGAHCVSLSGQCLMSSAIGGRSANRGECAQPCRLPYKSGGREGYLLSLADMCCAADIPALIASGVRSLKVEGRQKDENYVYGVGKLYRTLLDERRSATPDEIEAAARLFERGFTDGYLRRDYRNMCGVRSADAGRDKPFRSLMKRAWLDARLELYADRPAKLTLKAQYGAEVTFTGSVPGDATGDALTKERARSSLSKLGGTPYELRTFEYETDGRSWLSAAELNGMRRSAVEQLLSQCRREERAEGAKAVVGDADSFRADEPKAAVTAQERKELRIAEFSLAEQICPAAIEYFDRLYLPYTEYEPERDRARGVSLSLPAYMTDGAARQLAPMICPGDRVLAHTVGQIEFVRSLGAVADASFRLNVFNSRCAAKIARLLCGAGKAEQGENEDTSESGAVILSPELNIAAMRDIARSAAASGAVVYGKLPVMYTVRCMLRGEGGVADCAGGGFGGYAGAKRGNAACRGNFVDRTGAGFFVLGAKDCTNTVYNSVPVWMADREGVLRQSGISVYDFIFSDESAEEVERVIRAYRAGEGAGARSVRRIK